MTDYDHENTLSSVLVAMQSGDLIQAAELCRVATTQRPDDAEGWSLLGLCLQDGEGLSALNKAVVMEPSEPRWHLHLGRGLVQRSLWVEAEQTFAKASELSRGHPDAMSGWGNSLLALERYADAAQVYRRVLMHKQTPEIWMKAGDALMGAMDTINAAKAYESAYPDEARPAALSAKLSNIHIMLNQYDQAETFNKAVLNLYPHDPDAGLRKANILRWRGDHEEALKVQKLFWAANTTHTGLIAALLDDKDDSVLDDALNIAKVESENLTGRRRVCFALARHFDRQKDTDKAWQFADQANGLYDDGETYDPKEHRAQLSKAVAAYNSLEPAPVQDANMVYVMGPPRCGGSLLQTILSQAGGVTSVGERGALMGWLIPGLDEPESLAARLPDLAKADIAGMARAAGPANVYVDKTSPHIIVAGLLAKIHPGAQFVLPVRNKADMIVSMYFHDFPPQFAYTRSVEGIADYLAFQDEAATAWREAGLTLIDHDHDAFIGSPEKHGKALFEALGWDWSDSMLDTDSSDTVVRTFSARQVRGGVSQKYAGRGERYVKHLQEAGFTAE